MLDLSQKVVSEGWELHSDPGDTAVPVTLVIPWDLSCAVGAIAKGAEALVPKTSLTPHSHSPGGFGKVTCVSQELPFLTCKNGWFGPSNLKMSSQCAHLPAQKNGQWQYWWQWPCLLSSDICQALCWMLYRYFLTDHHNNDPTRWFSNEEKKTRAVHYFPQDHTASKKGRWNLNPVLRDSRAHALHLSPVLPPGWQEQVTPTWSSTDGKSE